MKRYSTVCYRHKTTETLDKTDIVGHLP